jgi:hypothetical protein
MRFITARALLLVNLPEPRLRKLHEKEVLLGRYLTPYELARSGLSGGDTTPEFLKKIEAEVNSVYARERSSYTWETELALVHKVDVLLRGKIASAAGSAIDEKPIQPDSEDFYEPEYSW